MSSEVSRCRPIKKLSTFLGVRGSPCRPLISPGVGAIGGPARHDDVGQYWAKLRFRVETAAIFVSVSLGAPKVGGDDVDPHASSCPVTSRLADVGAWANKKNPVDELIFLPPPH